MIVVSIVSEAADTIRARYLEIPRLSIPLSLRDERDRLVNIKAVQSKELALAQMGKWLADGYALYKAASLGLQPAAVRGKMRGPTESVVYIPDKDVCVDVQKAFKEAIVPPAKELVAMGAALTMSKDVREYLAQ